jgi:hypothetical protein
MPTRGRPPFDITGQRYGKLVAMTCLGNVRGARSWSCSCDCGKQGVVVQQALLRKGWTRSCGCLRHEPKHYVGYVDPSMRRLAPRVARLWNRGLSGREIGERLGIPKQRVYYIMRQLNAGKI